MPCDCNFSFNSPKLLPCNGDTLQWGERNPKPVREKGETCDVTQGNAQAAHSGSGPLAAPPASPEVTAFKGIPERQAGQRVSP